MESISWKNTLFPHARIGLIDRMRKHADDLEYKYFSWNGVIHLTASGLSTGKYDKDLDIP